jgi:hypothetical protein
MARVLSAMVRDEDGASSKKRFPPAAEGFPTWYGIVHLEF